MCFKGFKRVGGAVQEHFIVFDVVQEILKLLRLLFNIL